MGPAGFLSLAGPLEAKEALDALFGLSLAGPAGGALLLLRCLSQERPNITPSLLGPLETLSPRLLLNDLLFPL